MGSSKREDMKQYSMFRRLMSLTLLMILHASLFTPHTLAQDEPEYRMEVGGGLGLQGYLLALEYLAG